MHSAGRIVSFVEVHSIKLVAHLISGSCHLCLSLRRRRIFFLNKSHGNTTLQYT
uniref:Uncharacterized protein n=1 Tax=Anguilla anguilla TaxID=7936 RepID=A0A0E9PXD9_ANGAN